jgi:hypothetical protein
LAIVTELISAGFERLEYHIYNSAGYPAGATGTLTSGAAGVPAGRIRAVKTMDIAIPEADIVNISGDNVNQGGFLFPSADTISFTIEYAIKNLTQEGFFQGTNAVTKGETRLGALAPTEPTYVDAMLIAVSNAKSKDTGSTGSSRFQGVIIPKANLQPLGQAGFNERGEATFRYRVVVNLADAYPWGETFRDSAEGTTSMPIQTWSAENRITLHAFQQATPSTITAFGPLAYAPVSAAKTVLYSNGVQVVVAYTVDSGTKQLNGVTGTTALAYLSCLYEYTA